MCNKGSGIAAKPRGIENVITITAYGSSISLLQWLNRTKVETIALFCSVFFLNLSSCSFNITFSRKFLIFYYSQPNNVDSEISMLKGYYVSRSLYCYCKSHHGHRHVVELSVGAALSLNQTHGICSTKKVIYPIFKGVNCCCYDPRRRCIQTCKVSRTLSGLLNQIRGGPGPRTSFPIATKDII
ncbi:uncharacterized protein LOC103840489 isoform X1 [Brassica rapa]|uniref:uncharacterized protein LOC103840489 isoform X1 n=1 Tax=Brassica campestris TaxID=3711 RepID=UPI00142E7665|nr:uncharacterized protein LOC103840489 isoform X1 [Brassica rapa]